jgi:hypothetical protein
LDRAIKSRSVARALRAEMNGDDLVDLRAKLGTTGREHEKS